jgi:hypothetical protein
MAGRKSKFEELQIVERYAELSAPFFAVLKKMLNSKVKADQRFAIEQLSKAFPKMIPQQITGEGGGPVQVNVVNYGNTITIPVHTSAVPTPHPSSNR